MLYLYTYNYIQYIKLYIYNTLYFVYVPNSGIGLPHSSKHLNSARTQVACGMMRSAVLLRTGHMHDEGLNMKCAMKQCRLFRVTLGILLMSIVWG